jgi:hypothetical protein
MSPFFIAFFAISATTCAVFKVPCPKEYPRELGFPTKVCDVGGLNHFVALLQARHSNLQLCS